MIENSSFEVLDSADTGDGTKVDVVQFVNLAGSADVRTAENLYFANQSGMRLKMVRITLENSHARVEPGAMYYMKGRLEMKASSGGGLLKGLSHKMLSGESFAVLYSPVPSTEISKIVLENEKLSVDGNFALMRTEGVNFRAEKSSKSWISTSVSGEGLLQTFEGTGIVWIAPTQGVYEKLATPNWIKMLSMPPGSSHTETQSSN